MLACSGATRAAKADNADRQQKLQEILLHYWDEKDFADTVYVSTPQMIEQDFADFVFILSHQPDSTFAAEATANLLRRAATADKALATVQRMARGYLTDSESPMRDDELWLTFVDVAKDMPQLDDAQRMRYDFEHSMALKNRIGSVAADFEYELCGQQARTTLLSTPTGTAGMVLVFYDPDCHNCHLVLEELRADTKLARLVGEGILTMLAVDAQDDRWSWERTCGDFPQEWIAGFNTDDLMERDAYDLPEMPVIYVLDTSHRVVGKDISIKRLREYLDSCVK